MERGWREGMALELSSEEGTVLFTGALSGWDEDGLTLERLPGAAALPILEVGACVAVRGVEDEPLDLAATVAESSPLVCRLGRLAVLPPLNRRRHVRQELQTAAEFQGEEGLLQACQIRNISLGGACVVSSQVYRVGEELTLQAALGETAAVLPGQVVRAEERADGQFSYGFQFSNLQDTQVHYLTRDLLALQRDVREKLLDE